MGKRVGEHRKHIAALETLWYQDVEQRVNVTPILEIISRMHEIKYTYLTCNTKGEFSYNLNLLKRKSGYLILYLAFHGYPGQLHLTDHSIISLEQLAKMMGKNFVDWVVHFGSCGTLNTDCDRIANFMAATKTIMVSGYTRTDVDWLESAAMDILYFQQLQHNDTMPKLWDKLQEHYGELLSRTGFQVFMPQAS